MTVSSTTTRNSYTGDGTTTVFAYTFKIFDDDDITVILRTDATGGETVQTKTTDYTVSGVGNTAGGNITFGTAPASGITVVLIRETAQTQTTDYTPNDPFPAASHEDALDKLTLIVQDQQEALDRSIKISKTNTITSPEFTVGASTRANKIFAFDSNGDLAVTQEIGTYQGTDATTTTSAYAERDIVKSTTAGQLNNVYICIQTSPAGTLLTNTSYWQLLVDAVTAATSATNAAASATAAAASETAAAASESAAATSETNAATSASNASTSATNAATSATASAASASAASTSETNAATSATNASTSATAAASSATAAAASETAAAASESAAATSETNAATSATNAATSETNAATSETNAATSATNAATSATNAATAQTAAEAARDAIQQFYLGAQSSNPTVDGNGDPVTAGDWYFNTSDNTTRIYDGSTWNTISPDLVGDATPQLGGNLDTNGNDINFGDNDKAVFGAGSDLQIYHSGSASFIDDVGTGNLNLRADTAIAFQNSTGTEEFARFISNGAVQLNYDDSIKLATTATGIDVTGTITQGGSAVKTVGKETIWVPATAMYPETTSGCADLDQVELGNGPELKCLDFDPSSDEQAQFSVAFPKSWNEGTITYQVFFTVTGTDTGTVVWTLSGLCTGDNDSINTVFGTAVATSAKAHSGTSNDLNITAESSAVTISGAASEEMTIFRIGRDVSEDTQTGDARLLGVKIFFTTDAATDA